jgi:hypothetical protein
MFDNLRDLSDSPLYEDEPNDLYKEPEPVAEASVAPPARKRKKGGQFLGMTAQQRFLLSFMFMVAVCLIGTLAMFILGKMSIF